VKRILPNLLTGLRLVLSIGMFIALALIAASVQHGQVTPAIVWMSRFAFAAFVVAAVTDFFDGWLARRWQVVSTAGAILDPIADKILVCGAILGLAGIQAPGVLLWGGLILFREFAVSALREVLAPRGIKLPVTFLAKTKTTLQLLALGGLMFMEFWPAWGIDATITPLMKAMQAFEILLIVATLVTVWTGIEYARAAYKALKAA